MKPKASLKIRTYRQLTDRIDALLLVCIEAVDGIDLGDKEAALISTLETVREIMPYEELNNLDP